MSEQIQAVFESGVLRPLQPLALAEHEIVHLTITHDRVGEASRKLSNDDIIDRDAKATAESEGAGAISIEELREMLKSIPGSLSDVVISERGEY